MLESQYDFVWKLCKPCPFCGERQIGVFKNIYHDFQITCDNPKCRASGPQVGHTLNPYKSALDNAIDQWNSIERKETNV